MLGAAADCATVVYAGRSDPGAEAGTADRLRRPRMPHYWTNAWGAVCCGGTGLASADGFDPAATCDEESWPLA